MKPEKRRKLQNEARMEGQEFKKSEAIVCPHRVVRRGSFSFIGIRLLTGISHIGSLQAQWAVQTR